MDRRRKSRLEVDYNAEGDSDEIISTIASDEDTPETALVRKAEAQAVRLILNAMPRPFREILVLREIEELSYHQISEITALPIGTVMSRLARTKGLWRCLAPRDREWWLSRHPIAPLGCAGKSHARIGDGAPTSLFDASSTFVVVYPNTNADATPVTRESLTIDFSVGDFDVR